MTTSEIILRIPQVKDAYPAGHELHKDSQWIFIEQLKVIGTVDADCCVCAWREGHTKYPNAVMAGLTYPVEGNDPCVWWKWKDE